MTTLRRWFTSPWLTVRVQIALGAIFVAASLPKLVDPPSFAHMMYNYRLVPGAALNLMALVMPWIELMCGIALILGFWRRAAATIIGTFLLAFVIAISINLARDNAVNCGCFDLSSATKSHQQLIGEMRFVVIRDVAMLLMVAQILFAERSVNAVPDDYRALPDQVR
ncbi:MAG: MauE/DoxX family redox-associated membrane protein [Thermoanaerobaculia bacterium]